MGIEALVDAADRHLGVDRVALAAPATRVRVRAVDLDDLNAVGVKVADESGGVGAGRLDADHGELSELLQPCEQRPVALLRHGQFSDPNDLAT